MRKRGISPLIATVLLIGFIVALVAVVMLWGKGFIQEKAEKEGKLAQAQLSCNNVDIDIKLSGGNLLVVNKGSQVINGFIVRSGAKVLQCRPGGRDCGSKSEPFKSLKQLSSFDISKLNLGSAGDVDIIPAVIPKGIGAPLVPCSAKMKTISR